MKTNLFRNYAWLVETIAESKKLTFEEINDQWLDSELSEGVELSKSTFHRWRGDIQKNFAIDIECEPRTYKYYVSNYGDLDSHSMKRWMFQVMAFGNTLIDNVGLHKRIIMENIASKQKIVEKLIIAMRQNKKALIIHQRHENEEPKESIIEPHFIKMYKLRLYLFGRLSDGYLCPFGIERIKKMKILKESFVMSESFDVREYFKDCYGIVKDKRTPAERVVLRAIDTEPKYLRDLPLHHSQKEIGGNQDYSDFEYYISPTKDFIGHILSRGGRLIVLHPRHLAENIKQILLDAAEKY